MITLSQPTVGVIPAGTNITFDLPYWLDGYILQAFGSITSDFDIYGFDDDGFDTVVSEIYGAAYTGQDVNFDTPPTLDVSINPSLPSQSQADGFGFVSPYFTPGHPEERIPFVADDGLQIIVTADADPGGPPQVIKTFNVNPSDVTFEGFFDLIAQANDGIMVFVDGLRIYDGYIIDYLGRTVSLTLDDNSRVSIHAYGFGGLSPVNEQHFIAFSGNPIILDAASTLADVAVVQDGVLLTSGYTVSGVDVTITSPPSNGTDMAVVVYEGGTSGATTMVTETLASIHLKHGLSVQMTPTLSQNGLEQLLR